VDDKGLLEFYEKYFTYPLYEDPGYKLYETFGNRSIFEFRTWNPIRIVQGFRSMNRRIKEKGLDGNMKGEGTIQGGVFVFNDRGEIHYAQEEKIGNEIKVDEIRAAVQELVHIPKVESHDKEL